MADVRHIFLAGGLIAASTLPAHALDANDLLTKMKAAYEQQGGMTFTWGDVTQEGDDGLTVEVTSISMKDPAAADADVFSLTQPMTMTLEGIAEKPDGSYTIGHAGANDIAFSMGKADIAIASSEQDDINIPATPSLDHFTGWIFAQSGTVRDVTVTVDGDEIVTADSGEVHQPISADGLSSNFDGTISGLTVMLDNVDDMTDEARADIETLGLSRTRSDVKLTGSWSQQSGVMDISDVNIAIADVGTLDIALKLTGFDLATMQQFRELGEMEKPSADDFANKTEAAQAYQAKVMATTGKIGVASMSVGFTDQSITEKALTLSGEKKGLSASEMADTLATQASAGLAGLDAPAVSEMAYNALNTYLHDPQNISISIEPVMQTPLVALFIAAASAPQSIPQLLGLKIEANQ